MKRLSLTAAAALLSGCAAVAASNEPRRDEAFFARIERGMTMEEVRARLGPPDETMKFPAKNAVAWDYRYQDTWGYMANYSVTFGPEGRVQSTFSHRINTGGDFR